MNNMEAIQQRFEGEVMTASIAFYTWKSINAVALKDSAIHAGMNKEAMSWNAITYSLQTTSLITLGRIFDTDHGALSVHSFLNKCLSGIDQFGPEHLRRRKLSLMNGSPEPWLDAYIADAEFPSKNDIRELKRAARQYQKQYETIYKPIRNRVIAHKEMAIIDNTDALFARTRIGDIQKTLEFLYQLSQVIFQFLHNGSRTKLSDFHFNKETEVLNNVEALLARVRD